MIKKIRKKLKASFLYELFLNLNGKYNRSYSENFGEDLFVKYFFKNIESGLCYLLITAWLGLMYKEFFISKWLNERPLIYAISHQILMLAVAAFPALLYDQRQNYGTLLALGTTILGSFFTYEVCRKLDPKADPILGTYLVTYGPFNTFTIVLGTSVVAWIGALLLGYFPILALFQLLCVFSFLLIAESTIHFIAKV